MCFHKIAKLAHQVDFIGNAARKKGGVIGSVHNVLDPGGAASAKFANGAPITTRSMLDPNNWTGINPDKPVQDMTAEELEAARQARISKNVADINSAFAGREKQYADYANALRTKYTGDLDRQYQQANRNLRFSLAGAGLTGGSQAKDSGQELAREMSEGTIKAQSQANQDEANLRSADESSRMQLIGLAQSGGDIGNPAMQSASMLKANLQNAQGGFANTLGDVFGSTAAAYKAMQDARNLRRGLTTSYEQIYGSGIGVPQPATR